MVVNERADGDDLLGSDIDLGLIEDARAVAISPRVHIRCPRARGFARSGRVMTRTRDRVRRAKAPAHVKRVVYVAGCRHGDQKVRVDGIDSIRQLTKQLHIHQSDKGSSSHQPCANPAEVGPLHILGTLLPFLHRR